MAEQYYENEYDRKAKQSGQEFKNQALEAGYKCLKTQNDLINPSAVRGAETAAGTGASSSAAASAGTSSAVTGTAAAATETGTAGAGATAAAAGAPTGGIGSLVVLAAAAIKAGSDRAKAEAEDIGQVTDTEKESKIPLFLVCTIILLIIICCLILLLPSCAMFFPQLMERDRTQGEENEPRQESVPLFFSASSDKNEFFQKILGVDSYNITIDNMVQEYRQIDNTNIEIFKSIIDHALWNAFNQHALSYCTDYDLLSALDFITDKDMTFEDKIGYILFFDSEAALANYRSKKYPYTATHENGFYYTIGDYLDGKIPADELNNLLNYAEILTVLSQSKECAANCFSYSTFYDMLTSKQAEMLLFEIEFDTERTWSHEVVEEVPGSGGADPDKKHEDTPTGGEEPPDNAPGKENDKDKEKPDNKDNITVTPVSPGTSTPLPAPTQPPKESHNNGKDERDKDEKDEKRPSGNTPSKTKPDSPSKNKTSGGKFRASDKMSIMAPLQAPLPAMSRVCPHKLFRLVYAPDTGGGPSAQPTPAPKPTPTSTPAPTMPPEAEIPDDSPTPPENTPSKQYIHKFGFYYDCEIAPYGLLEIYTIAGVDPNDMNANEYTMRNIDVLDISEKWLRTKITEIPLGIDTRSPMQFLESDLLSKGVSGLFSSDLYYKHAVQLRDQLACDYVPDGQSVILDMQGYINQGRYPDNYRGTDGRGQSIKSAGCCDCSYTMIAMYLNRANYDIVSISRKYVSNNNFRGTDFLRSVGLKETSRNEAYLASSVIGYLTEGLPVMLHISGKWVYNGVTYHSSTNGHFLVIMGFDDAGFYVYDPGSNKNTTNGPIPYDAFSYVAGKSIRIIARESAFVPHYLVNTYLNS